MSACGPTISKQLRQQAAPVAFEQLSRQTNAYKGEVVILGGYILETVNNPDTSIIEVLQTPLDSRDKPKTRDLSKGRFLIRSERFLDPEIYSQGRKLTVAGKVVGVQEQPLDKTTYRYPVIEALELHLWPAEEPSVSPYPPYYYGWPHPWWPWYPWYHHPYWDYPRW